VIVNYLKVGLALLLLLCLLDMPYGFYQLVRFAALVVFGFLAFNANQRKQNKFVIVYGVLALLFQPFFKIALGRDLWNIVDVVVAIFLIGSLLFPFQNKDEG
jgi:hypothetical protein